MDMPDQQGRPGRAERHQERGPGDRHGDRFPAAGARQGDKLDCVVSSIGSAKSLAGGRLFLTPLIGPDPRNRRVFAFAEGPITLEDPTQTTTGRIHDGCRLEEEFFNVFTKDGKITLVLEKNHADFQVAQDVVELINSQMRYQTSSSAPWPAPSTRATSRSSFRRSTARIRCRSSRRCWRLPLMEPQTGARVVVNERAGSVIISGDVEIGSVAVTHKNIVIETAGGGAERRGARPSSPVDPVDPGAPKLKALVEALNAIHVPTSDIIEIIKGLNRDGKLHGQLIVE